MEEKQGEWPRNCGASLMRTEVEGTTVSCNSSQDPSTPGRGSARG